MWQRIQATPILLGPDLTGAESYLVRNFACPASSARALVGEYRKFLYLVATAGEVLAPSRVVDQVWHLHLDQPGSWNGFCETTIGRVLRHLPDRPAPDQDPAYLRTLQLMQSEFDQPAPERYWPRPGAGSDRQPWPLRLFLAGALLAALIGFAVSGTALIITLVMAGMASLMLRESLQPFRLKSRAESGGCGGYAGDGGCGGD